MADEHRTSSAGDSVDSARGAGAAAKADDGGRTDSDMPQPLTDEQIEAKLSYADIQRRKSRPRYWVLFLVSLLVVLIAPYGIGRWLAFHRTGKLVGMLSFVDPKGIALLSWSVTVFCLVSLFMAFLDGMRARWTVAFLAFLACVQFISGFCLLKARFWFSTYAVYGSAAGTANAANVGILAAAVGLAVFAVLYVVILVVVKKDSPLNVLTKDWVALIMFWAVEIIALLVCMLGVLRMFV